MGMSTHIQAFIPDTDPDYRKHKNVLLACLEAEVSLPKETADYFGSDEPERELLDAKLELELTEGVHYKDWSDDSSQGFEFELSALPKGITKIRFYNNW